jgi:hypothetical protein
MDQIRQQKYDFNITFDIDPDLSKVQQVYDEVNPSYLFRSFTQHFMMA